MTAHILFNQVQVNFEGSGGLQAIGGEVAAVALQSLVVVGAVVASAVVNDVESAGFQSGNSPQGQVVQLVSQNQGIAGLGRSQVLAIGKLEGVLAILGNDDSQNSSAGTVGQNAVGNSRIHAHQSLTVGVEGSGHDLLGVIVVDNDLIAVGGSLKQAGSSQGRCGVDSHTDGACVVHIAVAQCGDLFCKLGDSATGIAPLSGSVANGGTSGLLGIVLNRAGGVIALYRLVAGACQLVDSDILLAAAVAGEDLAVIVVAHESSEHAVSLHGGNALCTDANSKAGGAVQIGLGSQVVIGVSTGGIQIALTGVEGVGVGNGTGANGQDLNIVVHNDLSAGLLDGGLLTVVVSLDNAQSGIILSSNDDDLRANSQLSHIGDQIVKDLLLAAAGADTVNHIVAQSIDDLLISNNLAAVSTAEAVGQTGLGTGSGLAVGILNHIGVLTGGVAGGLHCGNSQGVETGLAGQRGDGQAVGGSGEHDGNRITAGGHGAAAEGTAGQRGHVLGCVDSNLDLGHTGVLDNDIRFCVQTHGVGVVCNI